MDNESYRKLGLLDESVYDEVRYPNLSMYRLTRKCVKY
jgi:hypothetical protein